MFLLGVVKSSSIVYENAVYGRRSSKSPRAALDAAAAANFEKARGLDTTTHADVRKSRQC